MAKTAQPSFWPMAIVVAIGFFIFHSCSDKKAPEKVTESAPVVSSYTSAIGFPPDQACSFLASNPAFVNRSRYTPFFPESRDDYACGTRYYLIPGSSTPGQENSLSYYVRGTPDSAKRVRILLNVTDTGNFSASSTLFVKAARELFSAAFGKAPSDEISAALDSSTPGKWSEGGFDVELRRTDWPTGKGFELNFIIADPGLTAGM